MGELSYVAIVICSYVYLFCLLIFFFYLKDNVRTSLTVHWLRLCLPVEGLHVPSLGVLRSHMP